jgi:predicted ribosomally synthesized peptide with nif11-like leader
MSKENVKLFYEAMAKDKSLQEKFKAISKRYEGQKPDVEQADLIYQKDLVPLAREAGFEFTLDELKGYAAEAKAPAIHELSEDELAAVAGGNECTCVAGGGGTLHDYRCGCVVAGFGGPGSDYICKCGFFGYGSD